MMTGPADDGVVVIDVETTGLGGAVGRLDGVVQVGVAWFEAGAVASWGSVCNPGEPFLAGGRAAEALAINRLRLSEVAAARPAAEVAAQLRRLLGALDHPQAGLMVLAFNVSFDRSFLVQPPWELDRWQWGPCLMAAAAVSLGSRGGGRIALAEACRRHGVTLGPRAHDAVVDASAALQLWHALGRPGLQRRSAEVPHTGRVDAAIGHPDDGSD